MENNYEYDLLHRSFIGLLYVQKGVIANWLLIGSTEPVLAPYVQVTVSHRIAESTEVLPVTRKALNLS